MPGTKRTYSFAFPEERSSKLVKRKSSTRVSASVPVDVGSPTPPALRRASTMSVEDETKPDTRSGKKTLKSKRSSKKPSLLTKKSSSFVDEGVLVTKLSGLRSGSVVGETSLAASTSVVKRASTKSKSALSKSESIRVSAVDETELSTAVSGLKSHLSKEGSKLSKKASVVSVSSISALKKLSSVKSSSKKDDMEEMDTDDASTSDDRADTSSFPPGGLMEVAVSFDTTGSMYGCLEEVRAKVQDLVQRLQADIPGIRIAIIAHGDYCDASNYIVKWLDFGASLPEICDFVKTVSRTSGGDGPECYELVLQRAREVLSWTPGSQRILIMIGDDEPHPVGYTYGGETYNIDWKEECAALRDMNVKIYGVQAGGGAGAIKFNTEIARITGGCRLNLKNFNSIFDFLMMICYKEANPEMIATYQQEILDREGRIAADVTEMTKAFGVKSLGAPALPPAPAPLTLFGTHGPLFATPGPLNLFGKTGKMSVKALTKAVKTKRSKAKTTIKKAANKKTKKGSTLRIDNIKKREKLTDACMKKGPLKDLKWTKWECAVVPRMPTNKLKSKYSKLRTNNGYGPKKIFDDTFFETAIYEVGVQLPGYRKKYVMYMMIKGFRRVMHWSSHIFRHKKIRAEINCVLAQGCSIYIRRASLAPGGATDLVALNTYSGFIRKNYDFAWKKYIWRRTAALKSFELKHRSVEVSRGGKTYKLSDGDM